MPVGTGEAAVTPMLSSNAGKFVPSRTTSVNCARGLEACESVSEDGQTTAVQPHDWPSRV